jgi:hypothetical protein
LKYQSHELRGGAFSGFARACGSVALLIKMVRRGGFAAPYTKEDKYRPAEGKKSRPAARP